MSLSDISISDEQDALLQVINHGSIHKAGFLQEEAIFALSHDEQLAIYPVNRPVEGVVEPSPIRFGDVRPGALCDYVVDIIDSGRIHLLAAGSHNR